MSQPVVFCKAIETRTGFKPEARGRLLVRSTMYRCANKGLQNYPKQCVRHFEIDTPFHCVQSKSNPFQCCQLNCIISYTSATFVYWTDTVYIGNILQFFRSSVTTRHPLSQCFSKLVKKTYPFPTKITFCLP